MKTISEVSQQEAREIEITLQDHGMLLAFIEKLSLCPNVTVNIVFQTVGNITDSTVSLVNANGRDMKIDCKAKKGLLR